MSTVDFFTEHKSQPVTFNFGFVAVEHTCRIRSKDWWEWRGGGSCVVIVCRVCFLHLFVPDLQHVVKG